MAAGRGRRDDLRVVFRVAAGPRQGYGHLVRATRLAAALDIACVVSIRGGREARATARRLGAAVDDRPLGQVVERRRPSALVVDDPLEAPAGAALRIARRRGVATVGVHDLGLGCPDADLVVDGSLPGGTALDRVERRRRRLGPRYMVVDPLVRRLRSLVRRPARWDVVVSLGGGARSTLALRLARRLVRGRARRVLVAPGFAPAGTCAAGLTCLAPESSLVAAIARARVAVVAGGITAYEAAALGVPAVLVAVVDAQRPTIEAFATRGAAIDGGALSASADGATIERLVRLVDEMLEGPERQRKLSIEARRLVDGRGAERVAALVEQAARRRR